MATLHIGDKAPLISGTDQEGKKISLDKDFHTDYDHKMVSKAEGEKILKEGMNNLAIVQDK